MLKKVFTSCFISFFILSYSFAAGPAPILGQVVASTVYVDGLSMPAGTTILNKTVVSTVNDPATIHLSNGQILKINRNSSAYLEGADAGQVTVAVRSGTVSYRDSDKGLMTALPDSLLAFGGEITSSNTDSEAGLKMILIDKADAGQRIIKVNDTAGLKSNQNIMLQSLDGKLLEVKAQDSIEGNSVILAAALHNSYGQGSPVTASAVPAAMPASLSNGAKVGLILGVVVAAGAAIAIAKNTGGSKATQ
jgi:hypothetical protein